MNKNYKVGVFDSGVGGLSVLQELKELPIHEFIYLADTANLPYGEKSPEQIIEFTTKAINYLVDQNVDAIVVACHTASAIALESLSLKIPLIGVVDPVIEAAVTTTKNNIIGVIGTPATITSLIHEKKIKECIANATVFSQACPQFVPLIEDGLRDAKSLHNACVSYFTPLQEQYDTIIIGCTHYEFIREEIASYFNKSVTIISAPKPTRDAVSKALGIEAKEIDDQHIEYYVTGDVQKFKETAKSLLSVGLENVTSVALKDGLGLFRSGDTSIIHPPD
jgi:glutamate racemase